MDVSLCFLAVVELKLYSSESNGELCGKMAAEALSQGILRSLVLVCVCVCPECKSVLGTAWGTRRAKGPG